MNTAFHLFEATLFDTLEVVLQVQRPYQLARSCIRKVQQWFVLFLQL